MLPARESRTWRVAATTIVLVATGSIVSTYSTFNNFYDEPAHLAAGMEWLSKGTFTLEPQHPPLSRVAAAILPWAAGDSSHGNARLYIEGREILGRGEHYTKTLTLARLGMLPFLFALAFVVWAWTRRLADERTAAVAVGLICANPNILAHAGIAGTDIGPAALMPAALLAFARWLEQPDRTRSVVFGATLALCGLTKFSAGAYWVVAAALLGIAYFAIDGRHRTRVEAMKRFGAPCAIALGVAALVTWAAYRFHVGRVDGIGFAVPAPEFWIGLRDFFRHGTGGHPAYLLGRVSLDGWWYYDLIALAVKSPIPLLLLGAAGGVLAIRARTRDVVTIAAMAGIVGVLLLASLTPVDIGIRLDLPVYAMLSVLAAVATSRFLASTTKWVRIATLAMGAWTVAIPLASYPDHIAYFNEIVGRKPWTVLVDSNLDWGQDLYRLRDAVNEVGMDSLRVHYFGSTEFAAIGLERARRLAPNERVTGWVAASETFYAGVWADSSLNWLRAYEPVARIGASIRLYHIK